MNTKGLISIKMVNWIPRIIFIIIVGVSVFALINSYIVKEVKTFDLETDLFIHRLIYSPYGISYYDELLGRVYPGVIDLKKLSAPDFESRIMQEIQGGKTKTIAAKIILKNERKEEILTTYYDQYWYQRGIVKAMSKAGLQEGARHKEVTLYALIRSEPPQEPKKGSVTIDVVMPE